jgi:hypothetical protein
MRERRLTASRSPIVKERQGIDRAHRSPAITRRGGTVMAITVRRGMDVCGSDGRKIGKVTRLFSGAAVHMGAHEHGDVDVTPDDGAHLILGDAPATYDAALIGNADYGSGQVSGIAPFAGPDSGHSTGETPEGAATFAPSDTKYMEVHHHGLLGRHQERIYVPFSAVEAISEDNIVLDCTYDEAARLYSDQPSLE